MLERRPTKSKSCEPDGPGAAVESTERRPVGVSPEQRTDANAKERKAFAGALAQRIEIEVADEPFDHLVLFASSPFLSDLRTRLGPRSMNALADCVDMDLTSSPFAEMADHVNEALSQRRGEVVQAWPQAEKARRRVGAP